MLSVTRHSLDFRLAKDLQLGREAKEPQRPSMEGVGSFPREKRKETSIQMLQRECNKSLFSGKGRDSSEGTRKMEELDTSVKTYLQQRVDLSQGATLAPLLIVCSALEHSCVTKPVGYISYSTG